MTAILGRVHELLAAAGQDVDDDLDVDPALAACVQHSLPMAAILSLRQIALQ